MGEHRSVSVSGSYLFVRKLRNGMHVHSLTVSDGCWKWLPVKISNNAGCQSVKNTVEWQQWRGICAGCLEYSVQWQYCSIATGRWRKRVWAGSPAQAMKPLHCSPWIRWLLKWTWMMERCLVQYIISRAVVIVRNNGAALSIRRPVLGSPCSWIIDSAPR